MLASAFETLSDLAEAIAEWSKRPYWDSRNNRASIEEWLNELGLNGDEKLSELVKEWDSLAENETTP